MALEETPTVVTDLVVAELVDCTPPPETPDAALPPAPEESPTAQSQDATIEQTGAGPPPKA
jgi:hypothetical protein